MKFMETSAKASINVEESFVMLARDNNAKMDNKNVSLLLVSNSLFNHSSSSLYLDFQI